MIPTKKCKICRSTGQKIGLNERCMGHKCALDRRRVRPGQHGKRMKVISQYARELIEKQKIKYYYLLKEKQLRQYIERAQKSQEPAPNALVKELERKLDNIVYLLGFSPSKTGAHQLVAHGHFLVNGKRIKSGNHLVQVGDVIEVRPGSADIKPIKDAKERFGKYTPPVWLKMDQQTVTGTVVRMPEIEEVQIPFNLGLIIDFYSRH